MASAGALDQNVNTGAGLASILSMLLGKKGGTETTTGIGGGTTTTQTLVNPQDIMRQLLEGAGTAGYGKAGLAATAGAQNRAGMYNSSTNNLLMNDLLSRVATEASIAAAPKVVTTNPMTVTRTGVGSQAGLISGSTAGLGLLALLAGSKSGRKKMGDIWDEIFGSDKISGGGTDQGGIPTALQGISPGDFNFVNPAMAYSDDANSIASSVAGSIDAFGDDVSTAIGSSNSINGLDATSLLGAGAGFGALAGTLDTANAVGAAGGDALGSLISDNAANWGVDVATDSVVPGAGSFFGGALSTVLTGESADPIASFFAPVQQLFDWLGFKF